MTINVVDIDAFVSEVTSKNLCRKDILRLFETFSNVEKEEILKRIRDTLSLDADQPSSTASPFCGDDLLVFRESWQEVSGKAAASAVDVTGAHWIVFREKHQTPWLDGLTEGCLHIVPGTHVEQLSETLHACPPDGLDGLQALLPRLIGRSEEPVSLVYAWSKGKGETGVHRLFTFFTALLPFAGQIESVILIGDDREESLDSCWEEAWIGFQRSVKLHFPETSIAILYCADERVDLSRVVTLTTRHGVIRIRGDKVFTLALHSETVAGSSKPPALKHRGAYLITGGAGGLGLVFARHLAQHFQARLVLLGRRPLSERISDEIQALTALGASAVQYEAVDVCDEKALTALAARMPFTLSGILHAAGIQSSEPFFDRSVADIRAVMDCKTTGTLLLDRFFGQQPLDFVCYFSSSAALLGDLGSCDYAAANRFLMRYGALRAKAGQAAGKTLVVNWPLWSEEAGGMSGRDPQHTAFYLKSSGQIALSGRDALPLWCDLLKSDLSQALVMAGDRTRIETMLRRFYPESGSDTKSNASSPDALLEADARLQADSGHGPSLEPQVRADIRSLIAEGYNIPLERLEDDVHLAEYGLDSLNLTRLALTLAAHFSVPFTPALFFTHITIAQLTAHFTGKHAAHLENLYRPATPVHPHVEAATEQADPPQSGVQPDKLTKLADDPIAIIGMSGRFPEADTVDEFWSILSQGRDVITDIPRSRWDWRDYFVAPGHEANRITTNKGGFLRDIEHFDALFFEVAPREAQLMDPAQRLLLMESYLALENAGFSPQALRGSTTAVFVGMEESQYELMHGWGGVTTGGASMIASRLSYFLDFHGPCIATNTACSSGLVAFHQAVTSLRQGECDMALVAGVSLSLSPESYMTMSAASMLSLSGQCRSFADDADGIGIGEAVVVVVLTRLSSALAQKNPVLGIVRASGVNFDGKTNGVTAPNGKAQQQLIERLYAESRIDVNAIGHIVTHGTGTRLGDPVEVIALTEAFGKLGKTALSLSTALTSCKSNIGHTMAASGLVSLVSLLQGMRHGQIPPSLHSGTENPDLGLMGSGFHVNKSLSPWQRQPGKARLGAVSSFGRSGTNSHIVIAEYIASDREVRQVMSDQDVAVVLSAVTPDRLRQKVRDLLHFLEGLDGDHPDAGEIILDDIAYTLQMGRDAKPCRLGFQVGSLSDLREKLAEFLDDGVVGDSATDGSRKQARKAVRSLTSEQQKAHDALLAARDLPGLIAFWLEGIYVDWRELYRDRQPRRVSLPAYPFAGEVYPLRSVEPRKTAPQATVQAASLGQAEKAPSATPLQQADASAQQPLVIIGGAGLFGLCMGVFLKKANIPFRIIEKNEDVGGVWFVNRWPGCGCDIPMLAYAYSFAHFKGDMWAKQADILAYLQEVARNHDLYSHISFNTRIKAADWQEEAKEWQLSLDNGEAISARYFIHAANEALGHSRKLPDIPGMSHFRGALMHTLDCRAEDWDFKGRKIAIIGNGTTQIQLVEALQPQAEKLVVYARSPKYIYPRATYGRKTQARLSRDYDFWLKHREEYLATADDFYRVSNDPVLINPFHPESQVERYFSRDLDDEWRGFYGWLRERDMVPDYSPGCSRPCMSHTYHRQIRASNVTLNTVPITGIIEEGIETAEGHEAFDIILLATGYDLNEFKPKFAIRGRNQRDLDEEFADFPRNYGGHFVSGFPNLFLASGANSGTNATSVTAIFEDSCALFLEVIRYCEDSQIKSFEIREEAVERFRAFVSERNRTGSFSTGCSAWYQTSRGENAAIFPGTFAELKDWHRFDPSLFWLEGEGHTTLPPVGEGLARTDSTPIVSDQTLVDQIRTVIIDQLSAVLEIDPSVIDEEASFAEYGIDSILGTEFIQSVNRLLPVKLEAIRLFDFASVEKLSAHILAESGEAVRAELARNLDRQAPSSGQTFLTVQDTPKAATATTVPTAERRAERSAVGLEPSSPIAQDAIAIVGMSGRFAGSETLDAFWDNLKNGRDLVTEVSRWDRRDCASPDTDEQLYCSRGSFIESVDRFDAAFFRISPLEAMYMDPQQRLFLEECWTALEHAGYAGRNSDTMRCGVFAGCSRSDYTDLFTEEPPPHAFWGNVGSIIPARIAYYLNLQGPAISVDTACSSSLVSVHLACQSLWLRETEMALAGGVFLQFTPSYYQVCNRAGMLSPDGNCHTFDSRANGFVPGEGVGVVVLKRLEDALRDGDTIHGVILGSGTNQDGSTNGITAPSGQSQQRLQRNVYDQFGIDPQSIHLVEAHGTGTRLGDPVEFAALTQSFRHYTDKTRFCAIGSVKTNIGHATMAAGVAGLLKLVLALKARQIPPTLHFDVVNPAIDFSASPFYPAVKLAEWSMPEGKRRRAAVSSYGLSGTNAHMVIEEGPVVTSASPAAPAYLVALSARTAQQLVTQAENLLAHCRLSSRDFSLNDISHTLLVGRLHLTHRLGLIVRSQVELIVRLEQWLTGRDKGQEGSGIHAAVLPEGKLREQIALKTYGNQCIVDCRNTTDETAFLRFLTTIADLYIQGYELNFRALFAPGSRRIPLPTYPFERERHWVEGSSGAREVKPVQDSSTLHPLLHSNTSNLLQQRFTSRFTGEEFFLKDHRIQGEKILPAVAYLEMVRAAMLAAVPEWPADSLLEVRDTVWLQPLKIADARRVSITLSSLPSPEGQLLVAFEVVSGPEQQHLHCQGKALLAPQAAWPAPDVQRLEAEMNGARMDAAELYAGFVAAGVDYGPAHRGISSISFGIEQCLARLALPQSVTAGHEDFVLHPSLLDSAFQACIGFITDLSATVRQVFLPFSLDAIRIIAPRERDMLAFVRPQPGRNTSDRIVKLDIDLIDLQGNPCAQLRGLSFRPLAPSAPTKINGASTGVLLAVPVWEPGKVPDSRAEPAITERHVILCDSPLLAPVDVEHYLPGARYLRLDSSNSSDLAARYSDVALAAFSHLQTVLKGKPRGKVLVQIVIPDKPEHAMLIGLSALLKTAELENPAIAGQIIFTEQTISVEQLASHLTESCKVLSESILRYRGGVRQVLGWQEKQALPPVIAFKDRGVYLITGGLGGLGMMFASDILRKTAQARVILTGRSPLNTARHQALQALSPRPDAVEYWQVDMADGEAVAALIRSIESNYGHLDGILHCAGVLADQFMLTKTAEEFRRVLAPKVAGSWHLEQASRHLDLDFLVLFSSVVSVIGSLGQIDYAAANGFMDGLAAYRNHLVAKGERRGQTLSINWPLWQEGGMQLDETGQRRMREATGMMALKTEEGLKAFHQSLALGEGQVRVMEGDMQKMRSLLEHAVPETPVTGDSSQTAVGLQSVNKTNPDMLKEKTEDFLRRRVSQLLKLPVDRIDARAALEDYGIDSIMAVNLTHELEKTFGALSKTLFFEYQTLGELADHFLAVHGDILTTMFAPAGLPARPADVASTANVASQRVAAALPIWASTSNHRSAEVDEPIAIIGLSGRYPQSRDLGSYWKNLREGRDCITEVPASRWNWRDYFTDNRTMIGHHFSKWGGFIEGVDEFDPFFFNMSPREAEYTDPQERLFLQHAWMAMEDAGYTRVGLQQSVDPDLAGEVGVYVGVMYGEYQIFGAEASLRGQRMGFAGSLASIANRVSYVLNLHGPSLTLDTMCSSSLTAIHLACQDLKLGRTSLAIAGGVNITIHPNKYLMLSAGQFISGDGRCQSFGEGGDGYIPAEGVGAVVLKRLSEAEHDGDVIHGVIRASTINHGGKTNGYTVPNPQAQARAVRRAMEDAGVDPRHISYVEAHGTGTKLGDPIEIAGLTRAFAEKTKETGFCFIGSAKSNIGHGESAAGIAGLTKVLLQMKHREIVPSLHSSVLNPNIDFARTPFVVNQTLRPWDNPVIDGRSIPRIAGLSSFGAGGSNAHLIIEEYVDGERQNRLAKVPDEPVAILLSAKNAARLRERVEDLQTFLKDHPQADLANIAYTLQVGREPMEERVALLVSSCSELSSRLSDWLEDGADIDNLWQGQARKSDDTIALFDGDADLRETIGKWILQKKYTKLLELWVRGLNPDWTELYGDDRPQRISLPTYPFARDRYWVPGTDGLDAAAHINSQMNAQVLTPVETAMVATALEPPVWDEMSYRPVWTDEPARLGLQQEHEWSRILIVAPEGMDTLAADVLKSLQATVPQAETVRLRPGATTERLSDREWWYNADDPEAFSLVLNKTGSPDCVIFLAVHAGLPRLSGGITVETAARHELRFLRLAKALQQQVIQTRGMDCFIVTGDTQQTDGVTPVSPEGAGLAGLAYALAQGDRRFRLRAVDISKGDLAQAESRRSLVQMILDEPASDRGAVVKFKAGRRYQQSFLKWQWPSGPILSPGLRQGGVYVIAGGAGTVGQILTRHLMLRYGARVVWLGRSSTTDPSVVAKLQQFEGLGTLPLYVQADVTDLASLTDAMRRIKQTYPVLHGAIFSSLVFHPENSIAATSEQAFRDILDVKIVGGLNFQQVLQEEELDFLCHFSSVQAFSFLSAKDSVGYASGITFADAIARAGRAQSRFPIGTINWGYWAATIKNTPFEAALTSRFGLIEAEAGMQFFDRFIHQLREAGADQLLFMPASDALRTMMGVNEKDVSTIAAKANPSLFASLKEEYHDETSL